MKTDYELIRYRQEMIDEGLKKTDHGIGWGTLPFGKPCVRTIKGSKRGKGYEIHYNEFKVKNGTWYHHIDYYTA